MSRSSVWISQAEHLGDRRGRLLRALQRRGDDRGDVAAAQRLGGVVRHLLPVVGQPEAGQPAVQDAVGVVHLAVAQQVHGRPGHARSFAVGRCDELGGVDGGGGPGGVRQGLCDPLQRRVVVRGADEPRLVRARRQVDAAGEHLVEERLVAQDVLLRGGRVVDDRVVGEEDAEQAAGAVDAVRHARRWSSASDASRPTVAAVASTWA